MSAATIPRDARNVMASRREPDDSLDDFPTPPWATRALCRTLIHLGEYDLPALSCWEPACGRGHMAKPLAQFFQAVAVSDVHDYGHGQVLDFLWPYEGTTFDWIITNPPFRLAEQFALTAIERSNRGVALIVRTAFLEGVGRHKRLFSKQPPAAILQFTERVPMHRGRLVENGSTATAYCWIVWRKFATLHPVFHWIPPCRRKLERPGDYEAVIL